MPLILWGFCIVTTPPETSLPPFSLLTVNTERMDCGVSRRHCIYAQRRRKCSLGSPAARNEQRSIYTNKLAARHLTLRYVLIGHSLGNQKYLLSVVIKVRSIHVAIVGSCIVPTCDGFRKHSVGSWQQVDGSKFSILPTLTTSRPGKVLGSTRPRVSTPWQD